jgi:hypothetical protein
VYSYQTFTPRTAVRDGEVEANGFRLRSYSVNMDAVQSVPAGEFKDGVRLALQEL